VSLARSGIGRAARYHQFEPSQEIRMRAMSKADIIRNCFEAYRKKDRELLENLLAEDFTFTSPYDDRIDKTAYFERCWPNSLRIKENTLEKILVEGDEAFVRYKCTTHDGKEFRNTEFFTLEGDKIRSVDVYFGATYVDGAFVRQK
jgi:ketosteroid isomerase-like protein